MKEKLFECVGGNQFKLAEKKISDPTKEEMLQFLQQQFGREEGFEGDAEAAMYWFANFNHGGQWSNLYSVLSTSRFSPGPIARGPQPESSEEMMYQALEAEYGGKEHQHGQEPPHPGEGDEWNALQEDSAVGGGTGMGMSVTGAVQGYQTPNAFQGKTKHPKDVPAHRQNENEVQGDSKPNPLDGKSNQVAAKAVNTILATMARGMFSDNSWEAINKIFSKLNEAGIPVETLNTKYGGQSEQSPMPTFKEWQIKIPFTNNKGKPTDLVGQITAHGAGSVQQPLDRYDITAYVTPVARKMDEEEQPEPYDAETDTFAPGPRQRPEDWKSVADTTSVPKLQDLLKPRP